MTDYHKPVGWWCVECRQDLPQPCAYSDTVEHCCGHTTQRHKSIPRFRELPTPEPTALEPYEVAMIIDDEHDVRCLTTPRGPRGRWANSYKQDGFGLFQCCKGKALARSEQVVDDIADAVLWVVDAIRHVAEE